jgi:hypothetical protein
MKQVIKYVTDTGLEFDNENEALQAEAKDDISKFITDQLDNYYNPSEETMDSIGFVDYLCEKADVVIELFTYYSNVSKNKAYIKGNNI